MAMSSEKPASTTRSNASHEAAIARISTQITAFHKAKTPYRIYHGSSTNTTRPSSHTRDAVVNTSQLTAVLSVDTDTRTAICQPNVPMHVLARATLPLGLVAPATPEFPMITVGGAFAGTAGESSSFKHGFFDRCVRSVRMVLPTGDVVRCEKRGENEDLYAAAVGSMGTLGVAVELEVGLEPCEAFVRTRYFSVGGMEDAQAVLAREIRAEANDFVDGILYSATSGVVVVGRFATRSAAASLPIRRFTRARDQWFYLHAQRQATRPQPNKAKSPDSTSTDDTPEDLIPTYDYLFRYDRSAFWMGTHAFPLFHVPFTRATRAALDRLLHTKTLYAALGHSGYSRRFLLQDLIVPFASAGALVAWLDERLGVWPLWLCPIDAAGTTAPMHAPRRPDEAFFLNVGAWGPGRRGYGDGDGARWEADNRALEAEVAALGGRKWLYALVFAASEDEFWESQGIDRAQWDAARRRAGADGGLSVWDKVRWKGAFGRTSKVRGLARLFARRDAVLLKA